MLILNTNPLASLQVVSDGQRVTIHPGKVGQCDPEIARKLVASGKATAMDEMPKSEAEQEIEKLRAERDSLRKEVEALKAEVAKLKGPEPPPVESSNSPEPPPVESPNPPKTTRGRRTKKADADLQGALR